MIRSTFQRSSVIGRNITIFQRNETTSLLKLINIDKSLESSSFQGLAKIVATIGPASENIDVLPQVVKAGMRIMRINFSHATYEEADLRVKNLRLSPGVTSTLFNDSSTPSNLRAVMLDTQGPEIRTGSFEGGVKEVELRRDSVVALTTNPSLKNHQTPSRIWLSYEKLFGTVSRGDVILLDDGAIELEIKEIKEDIIAVVRNTGVLGNKKGVNLPGLSVELPAMSDKDRQDIRWGIQNDIDFIAASFTRKASDVQEIRSYCFELLRELHGPSLGGHRVPLIISKIESVEALQNFESILEESDGIMVARGDLGVEIPMETLTSVQKEIVTRCNQVGKPVIVATQMLESMQKNPRPTRAECTDVANAVLDGADCVMLSGESAKGKYPVKSVDTMRRIVLEAEKFVSEHRPALRGPGGYEGTNLGLGSGIVEKSRNIRARAIVVTHKSADIAVNIARNRPDVPIIFFTSDAKMARQLQVHRGIYPVLWKEPVGEDQGLAQSLQMIIRGGFCKKGDSVIVISEEAFASPSRGYSSALTTRALTLE